MRRDEPGAAEKSRERSHDAMERVLEPEVMDTLEEANHYDAMDNSAP